MSDCCFAAKVSSSAAEGSFGRPAASAHATAIGAAISVRSFQYASKYSSCTRSMAGQGTVPPQSMVAA